MDLHLNGRVALVSAGSKGIGYAIAEQLLREGAAVAVSGRDEALLENVRAELSRHGSVATVVADVRHRDQIEAMAASTVARSVRFQSGSAGPSGRVKLTAVPDPG